MSAPQCLDRSFIRVAGADARGFLNNLLTQDLDRLEESGVQYGALLTPQGKVVADMLIWADGGSVILEADPAHSAELLKRLALYKLRAQVTLEDISKKVRALWATEPFPGSQRDPRLAALGWRSFAAPSQETTQAGAFEAHRIALSVPDLARDAEPGEVFALEALLEELNGVDFQKGCFVGQENVSRMKRRATTRRKFCPIAFEGEPPAHGAPVLAGEAELGSVRTGMQDRAMALLRLDRALEALNKGEQLSTGDKPVRLDPPPWLILPGGGD